ncbi:hypothetical protein HD806DRAFT_486442, partial [Xylariaceae sp. AK1471]
MMNKRADITMVLLVIQAWSLERVTPLVRATARGRLGAYCPDSQVIFGDSLVRNRIQIDKGPISCNHQGTAL